MRIFGYAHVCVYVHVYMYMLCVYAMCVCMRWALCAATRLCNARVDYGAVLYDRMYVKVQLTVRTFMYVCLPVACCCARMLAGTDALACRLGACCCARMLAPMRSPAGSVHGLMASRHTKALVANVLQAPC
jgi:hypothetical protein